MKMTMTEEVEIKISDSKIREVSRACANAENASEIDEIMGRFAAYIDDLIKRSCKRRYV